MAAVIEVREYPSNTPSIYLEGDGRLLLDLGDRFGFSLSKAATEGNEVNQIKREGTQSFSVPLTEKNRWILRRWLYPNALERDFSRMKVYAYDGVHLLPEDRLDVLRIDLGEGTVEVGLFESGELGVVDGANSLFLNMVDFGTFELTEANLEANWANGLWEDGVTDDFYFGLIHYGNFVVDASEVSPEDFRPLLSVPGTLVRGFCALGWVLDSPLLESEWFRRLWWYGLGKEYYRHSDWGRLVRVDVQTDADLVNFEFTGVQGIPFNIENYDLGNNHEVLGGVVSSFTQTQPRAGLLEYNLTGQAVNPSLVEDAELFFGVSTGFQSDWKTYTISVPAGETVEINLSFVEALVQGDTFQILVNGTNSVYVASGLRFTVSPVEKNYYYGDIIDIRESIDPAHTFLSFLQGLAHMGFRFDIDQGRRVVTMYQPEDGEVFAEGPFDGYYIPAHAATDLTGMVEKDSATIDYPKEDIPETLVIGFAKSTDKKIESLEIPEDFPLYAKRLTFSTGVRGSIEYQENPFFEATANHLWFGDAEPQISSPAMWDNTEMQRSFEIGPRILYAAGLVEQTENTVDGVSVKQWSYLGSLRSLMPYVFQVPGATVGDPPALPSGYITYDDTTFSGDSLWNLFLKGDNRFYKDLPTVSVLVNMTNTDYHRWSFRDRVIIQLLGRPTTFKVLAVRDFQTAESIPTPVTLQIDPADAC